MKKYILAISVIAGTVALSSCVSKQKLVECETTNKTLTEMEGGTEVCASCGEEQ